ncbi:MAG: menaquinol oxidoreductase [Deltaproteobacteria bacterium HGW-Deltaproteobacteria-12]|jgi:nitrate reductase gamma subunit|nr:MAG: menaquinol oxidoreductase [Deltaproteobacteria bacterium HGW-Deltaproteobacteria-12]
MFNFFLSLTAVIIMVVLAIFIAGNNALSSVLMTIIPYAAFLVFTGGFIYRMVQWWTIPVPFRIPTTCGQQKSLPWLKKNSLDNPAGFWSAVGRMALEIFLFRSLFRNTTVAISGRRPVYDSAKWLWFFGLLFHWSLLIIILRHLRFFVEPLAPWIAGISALDGFFEIGLPTFYLSDAAVLAGLSFLFLRRIIIPRWRYISLFVDYFALLLLLGIVITGLLMRHFYPADLLAVKNIVLGWMTLTPVVPAGVGIFFYIHLFLVFTLMAWFPFSKLMHMGGVFLSPTRMLANNNRSERHINPWNAPVKVHTYEEYEDEFRDKMKAAGLPVDKE